MLLQMSLFSTFLKGFFHRRGYGNLPETHCCQEQDEASQLQHICSREQKSQLTGRSGTEEGGKKGCVTTQVLLLQHVQGDWPAGWPSHKKKRNVLWL